MDNREVNGLLHTSKIDIPPGAAVVTILIAFRKHTPPCVTLQQGAVGTWAIIIEYNNFPTLGVLTLPARQKTRPRPVEGA